jgi:S1-C subfamily serine protease
LVNIQSTIGYDGSAAAGSGVVLTSDGIVLTNHHVIAGSTSLSVAVAGTTTNYAADVIGYDASHDIGVIKLRNASGLATAPLGDSNTVKIGDAVVGTGNAGGANGAPIHAAGTVTGLGKSITAMDSANGASERLSNLIETDANIQPGDSGGALAKSDTVIGIVTAGSTSGDGQGASGTDGFAIPINDALAIANDIRAGRASSTIHIGASAFLGISVRASSVIGSASNDGVSVARVLPNSAASKAGLVAGDVITEIGGASVTDNTSLRDLIAPHHPGDTVSITWTDVRGASHTQDVTFGSGPVG